MGCKNSIVVNAPAEKVWAALKNFHDMSWAPNVITSLDIVGDKAAHEAGAKRVLNGGIPETLLSCDEDGKCFTYSIDDGPGPLAADSLSGYVGKAQVIPVTADNSTFVLWTSSWESSKDGGVAEFCNPIYHALLKDLKNHFG